MVINFDNMYVHVSTATPYYIHTWYVQQLKENSTYGNHIKLQKNYFSNLASTM